MEQYRRGSSGAKNGIWAGAHVLALRRIWPLRLYRLRRNETVDRLGRRALCALSEQGQEEAAPVKGRTISEHVVHRCGEDLKMKGVKDSDEHTGSGLTAGPSECQSTCPQMEQNMKRAIFLCLLATAVAAQSSPPSIKGHSLGESISSFGPIGGPTYLETCNAKLATPAKEPKKKQNDLSFSRKELDLRTEAKNRAQCEIFVRAVSSGSRIEELRVPGTDFGKATFNKNVLVKLSMDVAEDSMSNVFRSHADQIIPPSYDEVLRDLIKKIGQPTNQTDLPDQNAYGAVFHHRLATWDRPEFFATVFEVKVGGVGHDGRITASSVQVTIETAEERRYELAQEKNLPSSLD